MSSNEGPLQHSIMMWGAPSTGKTTFLAALSVGLIRRGSEWRVTGEDEASTERLIRLTTELARDHAFPSSTVDIEHYRWALAGQRPRVIRRRWRLGWQLDEKAVKTRLDIIDAPGESFSPHKQNRSLRSDLIDNLVRSDAIIFLYDPIREFDFGDAFDHTFGVLVEMARQMQTFPDGRLPHYVAVCVTKFDEIRVLATAEKLGMVERDLDPPKFPRVGDDDARDFLAKLCEVSASGTAYTVLNLLEKTFYPDRIRYFVTSAVGFYVDTRTGAYDPDDPINSVPEAEGGPIRIRGSVRPINVVEPLLWLEGKLTDQSEG